MLGEKIIYLLEQFESIIIKPKNPKFITHVINNLLISDGLAMPACNESSYVSTGLSNNHVLGNLKMICKTFSAIFINTFIIFINFVIF